MKNKLKIKDPTCCPKCGKLMELDHEIPHQDGQKYPVYYCRKCRDEQGLKIFYYVKGPKRELVFDEA